MRNLILALDSNSQPHSWLTWQDAITLKCKNLIQYEFGEDEFRFRGGMSRISGEQSVVDISSIIVLKSKFPYKNRVPTLTNTNLFRRDLHLCAYCGFYFNEVDLTRDHINPVSRGGLNNWTNCVTSCKKCNNKKDDMLPEEAGMMLKYVPYVPDRAEGLILQNRSILVDQMEFLKNFLPKHSRMHMLN